MAPPSSDPAIARTIIDYAQHLQHKTAQSPMLPDPAFPLHVFPPAVATWLETVTAETRVPFAMTALPFLALTGATIGTQLKLAVGPGWYERPALWVAIITLTGSGKTPALAAVRHPFDLLQQDAWNAWRNELAIWQDTPKPKPARPGFNRLITSSSSIHALSSDLQDSTGLTILRDELYGFVRAMDRRGGEDRQHFLSLWSSEPLIPRRQDTVCYLPNPVVSIIGGLQPLLVQKFRGKDQDGFLERFLMIFSRGSYLYWGDTADPPAASPDHAAIVELLRALRHIPAAHAQPHGVPIARSPEATHAWAHWNNQNADRILSGSVSLGGFYRKFPSHLSRIALILHALWNPHEPTQPLTVETLNHAIDLIEFLRVHLHRSLLLVNQKEDLRTPLDALTQRIINLLAKSTEPDGWVSRSSLLVRLGRPHPEKFNLILEKFIEHGVFESQTIKHPGAGRPGTAYRIKR